MPRSEKQKQKLLYLVEILSRETDEEHYLSMKDLIDRLESLGIKAERKSIYSDIHVLQDFGYDIEVRKTKTNGGYAMLSNEFELAELKLLVDTVQTSKFITKNKSKELIRKLEKYTSKFHASELNRQVYVSNRVKTENESIYYNVEWINQGIQNNKQIQFDYYNWNIKIEMEKKNKEEKYTVSPWALTFQEEYYYLIAYDESRQMIRHYRVDKMKNISMLQEPRNGNDEYKNFDLVTYCNQTFGMYGGKQEMVTLQLTDSYVGILIDRFGKEIPIREVGNQMVSARISVQISPPFYGWICGLGKNATILSPKWVKDDYVKFLQDTLSNY